MKKMLFLSTFISLAMICSCQKQDSTAEAQLAQRTAELDAREKALDKREQAVAQWEKALATSRPNPFDVQPRKPPVDSEQAKAERERRIQQLPPELRALIPDRSRVNAGRTETNPTINRRPIQKPRSIEDLLKKAGAPDALASPAAGVPQASSPSPSPTPQ
jgi:hypothetical protein